MDAFLAGYFRAGNIGDETYVSIMRGYAARRGWSFVCSGAGDSPRASQTEFLTRVAYNDYRAVAQAISGSRCVIFPGGSVLQNASSQRSLAYYLGLIEAARAMKKSVYFLSQGLGPLKGRFSPLWAKAVLRKTQGFVARDETTFRQAQAMGVPGARLGADWSFRMAAGAGGREIPHDSWLFVLKSGSAEKATKWRGLLAAATLPRIGVFPFHPQDAAFNRAVAAGRPDALILDDFPTPAIAKATIARAKGVVSERLHPLYFAYDAGVPFAGVSDDPKVWAFCLETGFPCMGPGATKEEFIRALQAPLTSAGAGFDKIDLWRGRAKVNEVLLEEVLHAG